MYAVQARFINHSCDPNAYSKVVAVARPTDRLPCAFTRSLICACARTCSPLRPKRPSASLVNMAALCSSQPLALHRACLARSVGPCAPNEPLRHSFGRPYCTRVESKKIIIFAMRSLAAGEEVLYDYKFPFEEEEIQCNCGSPNCAGRMN